MKTEMQIQQENVTKLLELIEENPGLRILPMVDSEIVADDGHMWWVGFFGSASVEEVYPDDERIYIRSEDEESLIDEQYDNMADDPISDDEALEKAKKIVDGYEWEKVIAVRINLPS